MPPLRPACRALLVPEILPAGPIPSPLGNYFSQWFTIQVELADGSPYVGAVKVDGTLTLAEGDYEIFGQTDVGQPDQLAYHFSLGLALEPGDLDPQPIYSVALRLAGASLAAHCGPRALRARAESSPIDGDPVFDPSPAFGSGLVVMKLP